MTHTEEVLDTLDELKISRAAFARWVQITPTTVSRWANYRRHELGTLSANDSGKLPHHSPAPFWAVRLVRMLKGKAADIDSVRQG